MKRHHSHAVAFVAGAVVAILAAFTLTAGSAITPWVDQVLPVPLLLPFDPAAEVLARENDLRVAQGLGRLTRSAPLELSARNYAIEMAYGGFFGHVSPSGVTAYMRARDVGYVDWAGIGENIAAGQSTSAEAVGAWMDRPGHRANILSPIARVIGVGFTHVVGSVYGFYWVEEFGE